MEQFAKIITLNKIETIAYKSYDHDKENYTINLIMPDPEDDKNNIELTLGSVTKKRRDITFKNLNEKIVGDIIRKYFQAAIKSKFGVDVK